MLLLSPPFANTFWYTSGTFFAVLVTEVPSATFFFHGFSGCADVYRFLYFGSCKDPFLKEKARCKCFLQTKAVPALFHSPHDCAASAVSNFFLNSVSSSPSLGTSTPCLQGSTRESIGRSVAILKPHCLKWCDHVATVIVVY